MGQQDHLGQKLDKKALRELRQHSQTSLDSDAAIFRELYGDVSRNRFIHAFRKYIEKKIH